MSLIFLIGMPGSGKSSLARLWSRSYRWDYLDMDVAIVRRHGNIARMFEQQGEAYFREREQEMLDTIIAEAPAKTIIATGGGTPCFFDNLDKMKAHGCVIYIDATPEELLSRVRESTIVRPLLLGDKEEKLRTLLAAREPIYRKAHFTYASKSLTEATFAEIIDTCTNRRS